MSRAVSWMIPETLRMDSLRESLSESLTGGEKEIFYYSSMS